MEGAQSRALFFLPKKGGGESMGQWGAIQDAPDELEKRIDEYFNHCEKNKDIRQLRSGDIRIRGGWPTVIGLCNWLGISKPTYYDALDGRIALEWLEQRGANDHALNRKFRNPKTGELDKQDLAKQYAAVLARAQSQIEAATLQAAADGDMDTRIAQLLLSKWGYSQTTPDTAGSVTVRWGNVTPDDAEKYSG